MQGREGVADRLEGKPLSGVNSISGAILLGQRCGCNTAGRCAQCMAGAATAVASATGMRAYLGAHTPSWLDEVRMRRATVLLMVAAVIAAATLVSGSS